MKKEFKEIALNFVFGLGLTFAIALTGAVVSYLTDFGELVQHSIRAYGHLLVFVGVATLGRKIRNKFFKKGE